MPLPDSTTKPPGQNIPAVESTPPVAMPPVPPQESAPEAVERTRAVADALTQLGEHADAKRVAEAVKTMTGLDIDADEVAKIQQKLIEGISTPPPLDQPPPESARRQSGEKTS